MLALLDEKNPGAGSQSAGAAAKGDALESADVLSSRLSDASVESSSPRQQVPILGNPRATLLAVLVPQPQTAQDAQIRHKALSLSDAAPPLPLTQTAVAGLAENNAELLLRGPARARDKDGNAQSVASEDLGSSSVALVTFPQTVEADPGTAPSRTSGASPAAPLPPNQSLSTISPPDFRSTSGAVTSAFVQGAGSANHTSTPSGAPASPMSPATAATDSGLAFAARLNDGSTPAFDRSALQVNTWAATTPGAEEASRRTIRIELPDTAAEQAATQPKQDIQRSAPTLTAMTTRDEASRAASDANDTLLPSAATNGILQTSIPGGDSATEPHKTGGVAQSFANLEAFKDSEQTARTQPLREITIRVAADTSQSADVRMLERHGEIQVTVRASDTALNNSLRSNVNSLVSSLSLDGTSAEIWHPGLPAPSGANPDSRQGESGGPSSFYQRADQRFQQSGDQGSGREGRPKPEWLEDFE